MQVSENENLSISIDAIAGFVEELHSQPFSEKRISILNLFKESLREITQLKSERKDLARLSLNVRNIFELYITALHIYEDDKALKSWNGQLHKDSSDIRQAFKKLLDKKGLDTTALDEVQEFCDKTLEESHYQSKGSFNLKTCAEKYGFEDDYDFVYRLSSKLIHPSSVKVNCYDVLTEDDNYFKVLTKSGVYFSRMTEELAIRIKPDLCA